MNNAQPGILAPLPAHARYLTFSLKQGARPHAEVKSLAYAADGKACVVGVGALLAFALQREIEGLKPFPHYRGEGVEVPSTARVFGPTATRPTPARASPGRRATRPRAACASR